MIRGDRIRFRPDKPGAAVREGVLESLVRLTGVAMVKLDGDPFAVRVRIEQLSCVPNGKQVHSSDRGNRAPARKESMSNTDAKALRQEAQALGIEGYEDMGKKQLAKAVKKAAKAAAKSKSTSKAEPAKSTSTAKKAPARKAAAAKKSAPKAKAPAKPKTSPKKAAAPAKGKNDPSKPGPKPREVEPGDNPYRPGTGMHAAFQILKVGGTRRAMADKLAKKVAIHPHTRADNTTQADYDKRLILTSQNLQKNFGWGVLRDGRGLDGKVKIFPPGTPVPEAKGKKAAPAKSKPASSKGKATPAKSTAKKAPAKKTAAKKAAPKKAAAAKAPAKKAPVKKAAAKKAPAKKAAAAKKTGAKRR